MCLQTTWKHLAFWLERKDKTDLRINIHLVSNVLLSQLNYTLSELYQLSEMRTSAGHSTRVL